MVDLKAKLNDVPAKPGVYMMLDEQSNVIYVGKAKVLVNRLRQYFNNSSKPEKVMAMLEHVVDFRYIICQSEVDALVAENNLIKQYKPHYNILLKDDKSYPYIKINVKEKYPSITFTRTLKNDGAKYFGPYMVSVNIRDIFELIHTAFRVRDCSRSLDKPTRPCLNYHLGKCLAPCKGDVSEEEYKAEVEKVISFLKGNDKEVEALLKQKMEAFAKDENYEVAMVYRDKLKVLEKLIRKQVSAIPKDYNIDIFAQESNGIMTSVNLMVIRGGKFVGSDSFITDGIIESLSQYVYAFYEKNKPICDEVVMKECEDKESLSSSISKLAGRKINVSIPEKGIRKQLLDLATSNAKESLDKYGDIEERKKIRTVGAVQQLQNILNLNYTPNRIECYDISHISGTDMVASMVVFEYGEPKKTHYRRFRLKTVEGNNDFASMKEILTRRFKRMLDSKETDESFKTTPDLILLDGGLIQLKFAQEAMEEVGANVEMIGLTKKDEEIYMLNDEDPILLPLDNIALQLLQRLRDESHRFAISYHRSLHSKRMSESVFKEIKGVGDKTAQLLYKEFGSLENVKNASEEDLTKAGIGKKTAQIIIDYLSQK